MNYRALFLYGYKIKMEYLRLLRSCTTVLLRKSERQKADDYLGHCPPALTRSDQNN